MGSSNLTLDLRPLFVRMQKENIDLYETSTPGMNRVMGTEHGEFILVAEFHEQLGPDPILLVPENPQGIEKLDKNSFAVHLLSKDLQNTSGGFKIGCESQSVFRYNSKGFRTSVFAYYFALSDIHARGYMRQFCMTYVSEDYDKLMDNFQVLSAYFAEITTSLCYSNHRVFWKDVTHRIKDLQFTLQEIEKRQPLKADNEDVLVEGVLQEKDPSSVRDQLKEMEDIKEYLRAEMTKQRYSKIHSYLCASTKPQSGTVDGGHMHSLSSSPAARYSGVTPPSAGSSPYAPRRTLKVDTFRFQRKLRTLENISPLSYLYVKRCWESLQSTFSQYSFVIAVEEKERLLLHNPSSLLVIGSTPVINFTRTEGCSFTYEECDFGTRIGDESFGTPREGSSNISANSDCDGYVILEMPSNSQVEGTTGIGQVEGTTGIGQVEGTTGISQVEVTTGIGQVEGTTGIGQVEGTTGISQVEGTTGIGQVEEFVESPHDRTIKEMVVSSLGGTAKVTAGYPVEEVVETTVKSSKGTPCEDSSGEHYSTSISPDPSSVGIIWDRSAVNAPSRDKTALSEDITRNVSSLMTISSQGQCTSLKQVEDLNVGNNTLGEEPSCLSPCSPTVLPMTIPPMNNLTSTAEQHDPPPSPTDSDYQTPAGDKAGMLEAIPYPLSSKGNYQMFAHQVFPVPDSKKRQFGCDILDFCRNHVAVKDIMFALLQGRHFIITGRSKSNVGRFIQLLRLFVPGKEVTVQSWLDPPPKLTSGGGGGGHGAILNTQHLLNYKLIGMSGCPLPREFQPIVSHWDIDNGKLSTPVYNGKLLNVIATRNKYSRKEDFLAKIHCVFLELAIQAFVYYRALMQDRLSGDTDLKCSGHVLKSHTPHDQSIIKYLSSVIVSQQLREFGVAETSSIMKMSYKQNKRIECKGKLPRL